MHRTLLAACVTVAMLLLAGCPDLKTPRDPQRLPMPETAAPPGP